MMPKSRVRPLGGLLLVIGGLAIQAAAAFVWTPGTFIISAAIGAPMVVVGAVLTSMALARALRVAPVEAPSAAQREAGAGT